MSTDADRASTSASTNLMSSTLDSASTALEVSTTGTTAGATTRSAAEFDGVPEVLFGQLSSVRVTQHRSGHDLEPDSQQPSPTAVVGLAGEVDAEHASALRDAADAVRSVLQTARPGGGQVIVDVGQVTFMDSSVAAFLARLSRDCDPVRVHLRYLTPPVRFLLRVTQLHTFFDIDPQEWLPRD